MQPIYLDYNATTPVAPEVLDAMLFPRITGRALLEACPEVQASTGSACHAGIDSPFAVLIAIGIAARAALGAVPLTLGRSTTERDIEAAAASLRHAWPARALHRVL